jgi:hypothetical protein
MSSHLPSPFPSARLVGCLMIGAALLAVLAMAHHPDASGSTALARAVHGGLLVLSLFLLAGFWMVSEKVGLGLVRVKMAMVAYTWGVFSVCIAGTVNGFVVPALMDAGPIDEGLSRFAWELNQSLAYGSAYAVAVASVLWGAALVRRPGVLARVMGAAGLLTGAIPAALLATDVLDMHITGAMVVYTAHWLFAGLAGAWLAFAQDAPA